VLKFLAGLIWCFRVKTARKSWCIYGYKHDQIAVQSVRIPVSATRLVDLVLLSALSTILVFLMSVSFRNLSVSAAHDPHQGDLNLSKTCADLLQLAFSNLSFEVSVTLAFPQGGTGIRIPDRTPVS